MKILVTGGSGFIGRNLVERLLLAHAVLAPGHRELDLEDEASVGKYLGAHRFDAVVHCAVRPGHRNAADPSGQLDRNLRMFLNLASNRSSFGRMIFLGSGLAYGKDHYSPRMAEDRLGAHVPRDEGGFSKYVIARFIEEADGIVELRPFGVFGRHEDYAIRFISNAICKVLFDLPITLRQNRRFDYVCVDDLDRVIEHFLEHDGRHRAYNVTPDEPVELLELARLVLRTSGKDVPIRVAEDGMGAEYSGDNGRLRAEIPDLSFTPVETAVRALYGWYEENRSSIRREALLEDK
jgi:nucleoside-diphosphate-sugar epimerase